MNDNTTLIQDRQNNMPAHSDIVIPIPHDVEKEVTSVQFNSTMVFNFLMGVYTLVYGSTVFLYMSKKPAGKNTLFVLPLITILYISTWYILCIEWILVLGNACIPVSIPNITGVVDDMVTFARILIADTLLIWRCYHVWGSSIRAIVIPLILFVVEFGLYLQHAVSLVKQNAQGFHTQNQKITFDDIIGALLFISVATTASTSFLIGHRIHTVSKEHTLSASSTQSFRHIVFIVIESAAIYTIFLFADAIVAVLPSTTTTESVSHHVGQYLQQFLHFATGIAPTILVARVSMTQMKTEETHGGSDFGLQGTFLNRPANSVFNGAGPEAEDKPKSTNIESD